MSCLFPRNVTVKKLNGGFLKIPAPCGKCPECLKRTRQEWFLRNSIELDNSLNAFFVTLTYDDEHLPHSEYNNKPCFSIRDIQLFLKRFRKKINTTEFKYFIASEYGGQFGRPHYHGLFYNIPHEKVSTLSDLLAQTWGNGFISCSNVNCRRINYVCKYMLQKTQRKKDFASPDLAPFYLASRRPAIGSSYLSYNNICYHLGNKTTKFNLHGINYQLPQYYKRKIFDGYEHIKEEIRNDYLSQLHVDWLNANRTDEEFHKNSQLFFIQRKNSLQRFKKYSKEKLASSLTAKWIDEHLKYN